MIPVNEVETITSWKIRQLGVLINIIDLPNLPKSISNWTNDQHNHFEDLIDFAYNQHWDEISWNEVQVKNRISKQKDR
jgi:hypothetical protein